MAELLKHIYNQSFYNSLADILTKYTPGFDRKLFLKLIFDEKWESKELKERMNHNAVILHKFLPADYSLAVNIIINIIDHLEKNNMGHFSFAYMFLPAYIEKFGLGDFNNSVRAMERITQFTSCEFAVRPFFIIYPEQMIEQNMQWSKHNNYRVRRLASEGCRPRLPWGMSIPDFKKNPAPVISLIEELKNDPSEWVRKSVANNLNDISKDHPELALQIAKRWQSISKETDQIIKHGLRTLLKSGNPEALKLIGYEGVENLSLQNFIIKTPVVKIGEPLTFEFNVINNSDKSIKVRVEYAVYYKKANGTLSKKVFKISEKEYQENSSTRITRKQSFKIITTRKFHLGEHQLSIILNGHEYNKLSFDLVK